MDLTKYPDVLNAHQAAEILGVCYLTARKLLNQAEKDPSMFAVKRVGKKFIISKSSLSNWLNSN